MLSQPSDSSARWSFRVRVRTDEGLFQVGHFTSCPPRNGSPKTRCVAIAVCPGAREWTVDIRPAPVVEGLEAIPDNSAVALGASCCAPTAEPGLIRVSERPKAYTGTDGLVTLLPGEVLISWAAWAVGAGATLIISGGGLDAPHTINLPTAGTAGGTFGELVEGPATLLFAGTGGYTVEVAESA